MEDNKELLNDLGENTPDLNQEIEGNVPQFNEGSAEEEIKKPSPRKPSKQEEIKNSSTPAKVETTLKEQTETAMKTAAANAAVKAAIEATSEMSKTDAEKTYVVNRKKFMADVFKNDRQVKFIGNKIYAQYFGKVYTYTLNGFPITIKFDGSVQYLPERIYNCVMAKINKVSESNVGKNDITEI